MSNYRTVNMMPSVYNRSCRINLRRNLSAFATRKDVTEVRIPVPWGHVAGKWWGDTSKQPLVALHGWQDNAGTFDPILDRLDFPTPVLAIDTPGHGFSSHIPRGMTYTVQNSVLLLLGIKNHFGWTDKMVLLGHSNGGIMAFIFTALFPEMVSSLVTLDVAKPLTSTERDLAKLRTRIDKRIVRSSRNPGSNPGYTLEELVRRWVSGSNGSLTAEAVRVLLKRGAKADPVSGLYNLTRDPKVKIWSLMQFSEDQCLEFARNIKCHYLAVRFTKSDWFAYSPSYLDTLAQAAKSFKVVALEGTHHCHLNEPDKVAPVIRDFYDNHNGR